MERIMIIGSGGAGKSTLARQLGEKLSLPVLHLDVYFWEQNWVMVPRDRQIDILQDLLTKNERWIIDGNYGGTMDMRLEKADTVIFLDYPRPLCLYRAVKRMFQYRNKRRPDMREGNKERFNLEFYKWIWNFPKNQRPELMTKLNLLPPEKRVIILKSPKEAEQFLSELRRQKEGGKIC